MLWCVITSPVFYAGEDVFISRLVRHGVDIIHLRKPEACASDCARLLDRLTDQERSRITIHDFFELAGPYGLRGIHLNSRRGTVPPGYTGHVSRSCHSLDQVKRYKEECSYVFLSPVFDSISKQGYKSHFSLEELRNFISTAAAVKEGSGLFALGGVTPGSLPLLKEAGFSGAAVLGYLWEPYKRDFDIDALIKRLTEFKMGI